jgi:putative NADH-flavin reductase
MKVLILGASGRTGKHIVAEALAQGWEVKALMREVNTFGLDHPNLIKVQGTPFAYADAKKAFESCDVTISALNISRASKNPWSKLVSPENLISKSLQNVVDVAKHFKMKKLIVVSAWGVGDSRAEIPWWFKLMINFSKIGLVYKDHDRQERIVQNANLNYTIVRPVGLNDKEAGLVKVSKNGSPKPGLFISRKSLAKYLVKCAVEDLHAQEIITLSE